MTDNRETELIKAAQRTYMKEWRAKNKDKVKAKNQRYWLKKAVELGLIEEKKGGKKDEK